MDVTAIKGRAIGFLKKYRYVAIVIIAGIVLMLLPSTLSEEAKTVTDPGPVQETAITVEERLENILSQVRGAGKVTVMLTTSAGEKTIYQVDSEINSHETSQDTQIQTVVISDKDRRETGLVSQTNPPVYLGAIVVCQGADNPQVQLAITDAVSKITGLGTHQISILKMK